MVKWHKGTSEYCMNIRHMPYTDSSGLNNKQLSDTLHFWSEISVDKHNASYNVNEFHFSSFHLLLLLLAVTAIAAVAQIDSQFEYYWLNA